MTLRATGVAGVAAGAACIGLGYVVVWLAPASAVAPWLLVAGNAATMASAVLLGARRGVASRWLVAAAVAIGVILLAAFSAALVLPAEDVGSPLFLGLPRRLAFITYGIGIAPALLLPLAFARDFTDDGLDPESLAALRRDAAALRERSQ